MFGVSVEDYVFVEATFKTVIDIFDLLEHMWIHKTLKYILLSESGSSSHNRNPTTCLQAHFKTCSLKSRREHILFVKIIISEMHKLWTTTPHRLLYKVNCTTYELWQIATYELKCWQKYLVPDQVMYKNVFVVVNQYLYIKNR